MDMPSWISAISAVVGVFVAIVALLRAGRNSPDYAIVSSDGVVLRHRGFSGYGIHVELNTVPVDSGKKNRPVPEYIITFKSVPDYFEVSTMEGAVVRMNQSGPSKYRLLFVGAGYGSPVLRCNFKVQAF